MKGMRNARDQRDARDVRHMSLTTLMSSNQEATNEH